MSPLGASGYIIASVWYSDQATFLISCISGDTEWTLWVLWSQILAPQRALDLILSAPRIPPSPLLTLCVLSSCRVIMFVFLSCYICIVVRCYLVIKSPCQPLFNAKLHAITSIQASLGAQHLPPECAHIHVYVIKRTRIRRQCERNQQ